MKPLNTLLRAVVANHGFLTVEQVAELAELDRLRPVLVRCGCCRFTCGAQDVKHLCDIIGRDGQDYVRDVSLPCNDPAHNAGAFDTVPPRAFAPVTPTTSVQSERMISEQGLSDFIGEDYGGAFDGIGTVYSDADPGL